MKKYKLSTTGERVRAFLTGILGNQGALGKIEDEKRVIQNNINDKELKKNNLRLTLEPAEIQADSKKDVIAVINALKQKGYEEAKKTDTYKELISYASVMRLQASHTTDNEKSCDFLRQATNYEEEAENWAKGKGAQEWLDKEMAKDRNSMDATVYELLEKYKRTIKTAGVDKSLNVDNLWAQEEQLRRENADFMSGIAEIKREINDYDRKIKEEEYKLHKVEKRYIIEEANYIATGTRSGGTRVANQTFNPNTGRGHSR